MVLEDIKFKDDDKNTNTSKFSFRSRSLEIITDKGTITTPTRFATNSEILAKSEIPLATSLPMECCISFRPLEQSVMNNFTESISSKCSILIKKISQFNTLTRRAKLRLSFFQPVDIALDSMNESAKLKFADIQAKYLQHKLGMDIITYPFLNLPYDKYIDFINNNFERNQEVTTIFTLDMRMPEKHFEKVLNHLIGLGHPLIIPIIYRQWNHSVGQYDLVSSHFNNHKIAFLACQVEREDKFTHLSNLHDVIGGSFDLVALKQNSRGGDADPDLNKIRFFSSATKSIFNIIDTLRQNSRSVLGEFGLPDYNVNDHDLITKMLNGYKGGGISKRKFRRLYSLSRVHELITSKQEFANLQEKIRSKEVEKYIDESDLKLSPMLLRKI